MYVRRGVLAGLFGLLAVCCGGASGSGEERSGATGAAATDAASPILVSAAASLSEAMAAVAAQYEAETGTPVRLNVAGSQMLVSQIIEGAPVDLFVSADALQMERAAAAGRIDAATRVDLLSNQLVVAVPSDRTGSVATPEDLSSASVARVALGDPEAVPAGVYAREWLRAAGIWDHVASKVVPTSSVRAALRAVESGAADAGVVYRTDMQTSTGATVAFEVAIADGPAITYPAAITSDAPNRDGAARLLDYLRTPAAHRLFEAAGFVALP